jgi:MoaA/NifB/PqqE/SkfB family radical SAM enzyme
VNTETLTIDWNFGNECSLKCSYCNVELHDGANPFPLADKFCPAFDHLIDQTRAFSRVNLEFSGGEPTQSQSLQYVILSNTDDRVKFKLVSNGQASIAWWERIAHKLYALTLTYHLHTDLDHFKQVASITKVCVPKIFVAITPETWTAGMSAYQQLKSLHADVSIQLLYSNFTRGNDQYLKYTEPQWYEYYKLQGIDIANTRQVESTIEFKRINHLNNYYGHLCWAGYNQIIIDNFGDVYRGWCKSNNSMGNVFRGDVVLDKKPYPCPKQQCKNGFDLQAHKSKGSWGIA